MPILTIGATEIPYTIRPSQRARKKRIEVTPDGVTVVTPAGASPEAVTAFVQTKRRWLYEAVRDIKDQHSKLLTQRYGSGAKLQYRGRWLMLDVKSTPCLMTKVTCRSKFHIQVPDSLTGAAKLNAVRLALDAWLLLRAERDLASFCRKHAKTLKVQPKEAQLTDAKHTWGACGIDGVLRINWRLIQAPKIAMEYVTAHEVAHLIHRNHSPDFWRTLSETMPNWREGKAMLERWEVDHRAV